TELRRIEKYLIYCNQTKQELGTVNLLVQRNIPITFVEPAASVINDTIEPAVEPRIMKAVPVHAPETRVRQGSGRQETAPSAPKPRIGSTPVSKATPNQRQKRD